MFNPLARLNQNDFVRNVQNNSLIDVPEDPNSLSNKLNGMFRKKRPLSPYSMGQDIQHEMYGTEANPGVDMSLGYEALNEGDFSGQMPLKDRISNGFAGAIDYGKMALNDAANNSADAVEKIKNGIMPSLEQSYNAISDFGQQVFKPTTPPPAQPLPMTTPPQPTATTTDVKGKGDAVTTTGNKLTYTDLIGGSAMGLANAALGSGLFGGGSSWETIERREKEDLEAMDNTRADRERLLNISPEATRQMQAQQIKEAMGGAMSMAANVGAGQAAASGLGGDVSSAQIAGIKSAPNVAAAAGQYGSQLASLYGDKQNAQFQQAQQLDSNANLLSEIANRKSYVDREKGGWAEAFASANPLAQMKAGVKALDDFRAMGDRTDTTVHSWKNDPKTGKQYTIAPNGEVIWRPEGE
jgi:hypothetical protein